MRAIGEGIAEAALERIDDFLSAGRADRSVRRDLRMRGARKALGDAKLRRQRAAKGVSLDLVDPRQRRRLALQTDDEVLDRLRSAPDAHQNALAIVEDLADELELARNAPDSRAKSHALHPAAHPDFHRDELRLLPDALQQRHGAASQRSAWPQRRGGGASETRMLLRKPHFDAPDNDAKPHPLFTGTVARLGSSGKMAHDDLVCAPPFAGLPTRPSSYDNTPDDARYDAHGPIPAAARNLIGANSGKDWAREYWRRSKVGAGASWRPKQTWSPWCCAAAPNPLNCCKSCAKRRSSSAGFLLRPPAPSPRRLAFQRLMSTASCNSIHFSMTSRAAAIASCSRTTLPTACSAA